MIRIGLFLAGSLVFWGLTAYPAYLLDGETGLIFSAVAEGLCLAPGLASMVWAEWAFRKSPEQGCAVRKLLVGIVIVTLCAAGSKDLLALLQESSISSV